MDGTFCITGNPVHWSSRICRVREGVPPFGVLYADLPCFYTKGCFQDLNPWPYGHMTTTLPVDGTFSIILENEIWNKGRTREKQYPSDKSRWLSPTWIISGRKGLQTADGGWPKVVSWSCLCEQNHNRLTKCLEELILWHRHFCKCLDEHVRIIYDIPLRRYQCILTSF